jgi:predicted nucleic acid-binding protein
VKRFVLDASAVIVFFEDLPGADKVENVIKLALEGKAQLAICVVNWGEVCYSLSRARGATAARKALADLAQLPIQLFDADLELTTAAAGIRTEHGLPHASSFAAALARQRKASLVTVDRLFEKIDKQLNVVWADD